MKKPVRKLVLPTSATILALGVAAWAIPAAAMQQQGAANAQNAAEIHRPAGQRGGVSPDGRPMRRLQ
ncbi:hypothetical protein ACQ5SO_15245 [Rhodovulum sp. DZ06]|uniref:hypothetical protein n=1 Tax=Rhodovulum sp. DZ06 TaxID=3425126 RepID=UPI003D32F494